MPYPNEHSCRIKSPDAFQEGSFRRIERGEDSDKLTIIIGRLKGETTTTTQAYRYDKEIWTEDRAKEHCQGEEGAFEPAAKEAKMIDLTTLDTLSKTYATHNKIHSEYVDARWGARKKADIQTDHEVVVRQILTLGGRHLPKGEALDETLPLDLKEAFKMHYIADGFVLSEDTPPLSTIQILRTGTWHHPSYGTFTINQDILDTMVKNFNEHRPKPPTEMVVDWEHMSVAEPPQKSPAAGWVKAVSTEDGKLFADVEWTEEAAAEIRKKEYRFISPEFNLYYKDKETGKPVGATLLSIALTNRPFLEGMEPVVLSESLASMLFAEDVSSYGERENKVRRAYDDKFAAPIERARGDWVREVYEDYCIVDRQGTYYKVPYTIDEEDNVVFDTTKEIKVEQAWQEVTLSEKEAVIGTSVDPVITAGNKELGLTEWDTAYINNLPDNAFAYIKPGGEKEEGKVAPSALRYLPYKGEDGKVDLPHLRNALTRLPQAALSPEEKTKARKVLIAAAQAAGVGEYSELEGVSESEWNEILKGKEADVDEKQLRELMNLSEDADIVEAIKAMKVKADEAEQSVTKLTDLQGKLDTANGKLTGLEVDKLIATAVADGKLLPAMVDDARAYALSDREGFTKSLEYAVKIAPELGERGGDGEGKIIQLTDTQRKIAGKLGVTEEAYAEALKAEQEAEKQS